MSAREPQVGEEWIYRLTEHGLTWRGTIIAIHGETYIIDDCYSGRVYLERSGLDCIAPEIPKYK